ncbi:DUF559 domain-containing protein [Halomonas sp. CSM-2]|uniref:DUF559 domain-containing protein n=1 Tax=Halomonas sp. CSM-2 TaxID=1975722 RepID=UPI000A289185|nr:DUF559 domain-containing protein [Halomonas sp. CSM-2]
MTPQQWYAQNRHLLGSQFEHFFFENILTSIPDLNFASLQAQMSFRDDDEKQRYCDFAIREGEEVRIAIEVDGYDKRGTGEGMTHAEFVDWQRRQSALTSQGWHVLRFANHDVCNEPVRCRNNIHSLLLKLRHKEAARSSHASPVPTQTREPVVAPVKNTHPTRKAKRRKKPIKQELKKMAVSAGLVAAVVLGFIFYGQPWLTNQLQNALPTSAAAAQECPNAIHWSEVRNHMGETVTTQGLIKRITYKPDVNGSPTWIEVGASFPNPDRLTLLIWDNNRPEFASQLSQNIIGDDACVMGKVSEYRGDVQIQLKDADQLNVY